MNASGFISVNSLKMNAPFAVSGSMFTPAPARYGSAMFTAVQKITGGQVYNDGTHGDVKIRPVITSTAVGSAVTWEVAP